jgi:hypothetical protein
VKRSGKDDPIWVVIHICMEETHRIYLCSYLHLKLGKTLCFSFYPICFFLNKIREKEGGSGSAQRLGIGEVAQIMYTHVSKCKNNKIKFKKRN